MPCGEYFTSHDERIGLLRWRIERVAFAIFAPLLIVLPFTVDSLPVLSMPLLFTILITIIAVLGLNIIVGYTGELMLAQGALMGLGAYTSLNLFNPLGLLPAIFVGGAIASIVSLVAALPVKRLKGYYVAITTFALQFIVEWFLKNDNYFWLTGGDLQVLSGQTMLIGSSVPIRSESLLFYYFTIAILVLVAIVSFNISRTSLGLFFRAVRENDLAAEVLGVNVYRSKLLAFATGGFVVGMAGGLWVFYIGLADVGHYSFDVTLLHYIFLIFGGMGRVWGTVLGVSILVTLRQVLREFLRGLFDSVGVSVNIGGVVATLYGILIIIVLIVESKGFLALLGKLKKYLRKWPSAY
jgi:branched-chain amino acid transport system permease protein